MKLKFTTGRVAELVCATGKSQTFFWDISAPGLGLRVTAAGAKSYIFESRVHGKTLRCTIGDIRTWGVAEARNEATRHKALTDQGIDPRERKREAAEADGKKRQEAVRATIKFGDAWAAYLDARAPKWGERHLRDHQMLAKSAGRDAAGKVLVAGPLEPLMDCRLAEINAAKVRGWLRSEVTARPTQSALAFRLLRAFLNWCAESPVYAGIVSADSCGRRISKDELPKSRPKDDCLQREQLGAWFGAVRTIRNPVISAYLQTLLLIGARREELAELRWDDVDWYWKTLRLGDKVEGERIVPLTPYVENLLASLPRANGWVFSSASAKSGRLVEPSIQHRTVCRAAGIPNLTLHGLRRSFATLSEWVECPTGIVAQIMGHKPSAIAEKHYKRRPIDLLRRAHVQLEDWILEEAGLVPGASAPTPPRLVLVQKGSQT